MQKKTIAAIILTIAVLYIITPYTFEKRFFFNEVLSATGLLLLAYKRFRTGNDLISLAMILLLTWSSLHAVVSIVRMDTVYYYLRNMVIMYSMFAFFVGFYLLKYLGWYVTKIRRLLRAFIGIFIFIPMPRTFFERFGVAMLFPALFRHAASRWTFIMLILLNIIYGITYKSSTAVFIAMFLMLVFLSTGYRFFIQVMACVFVAAAAMFIYLHPNLALISYKWTFENDNPIYHVAGSHPLLGLDNNSTWRLVLWDELIVDNFPANIFGIGYGTPALKYYPVEDYNKIHTLPYVLGGHNSYVYLFARLGIVYLAITLYIYAVVFKEYFYHKKYYLANNQALAFWSFFIMSVIALFNPALETPIYAAAYWMLLGFVARAIYNRKMIFHTHENTVHS